MKEKKQGNPKNVSSKRSIKLANSRLTKRKRRQITDIKMK